MWAGLHFREKRGREQETRDGPKPLLPHTESLDTVPARETLTRDDANGDVHVVDLLREGGRHHARADQHAAQHHHQAVSKPAAQDRGDGRCRGGWTGLSSQASASASLGVCL